MEGLPKVGNQKLKAFSLGLQSTLDLGIHWPMRFPESWVQFFQKSNSLYCTWFQTDLDLSTPPLKYTPFMSSHVKCSTTHAKYSTCFPKFRFFPLEDFWIAMPFLLLAFSFIASFLPVIYVLSSSAVALSVEEATQSAGSQHLLTLIFQWHVIKQLLGAWQIIGADTAASPSTGPLTMHIQTNSIVCGHPGSTIADHRYRFIECSCRHPWAKVNPFIPPEEMYFYLVIGSVPQ